ncbi:hypothetical protein ACTQ43_15060 [Segatella copri]|uniref:hypothetical protein n=1 Tax=Bacteria TaxID=2 RepID=UPI003F8CDBD0
MDIDDTIAPKSDQLNAEDLLTGPRTFTVDRVQVPGGEQPVNIHLREMPGRPYRPSKTMRRVLIAAWGTKSSAYAGRSLTLYRDPDVQFGGERVGGIKISHLSDIAQPLRLALTEKRGKRAAYLVEPLRLAKPAPTVDVSAITDRDELRALWQDADEATRAAIQSRVAELPDEGLIVPEGES